MDSVFKNLFLYTFIVVLSFSTRSLLCLDIDVDEATNALFENIEPKLNEAKSGMADKIEKMRDNSKRISQETYKTIKKLADDIVPLLSSSKLTTEDELESRFKRAIKALYNFQKETQIQLKKIEDTPKNDQKIRDIITVAVNDALKKTKLNEAKPAPAEAPKDGAATNVNPPSITPTPAPATPTSVVTPAPTPVAVPDPTPVPTPVAAATPAPTAPAAGMSAEEAQAQAEVDKLIAEAMAGLPPA